MCCLFLKVVENHGFSLLLNRAGRTDNHPLFEDLSTVRSNPSSKERCTS